MTALHSAASGAPASSTARTAPVVAFVSTAVVGAGLFALCAADQLAHESVAQALPTLIAFGLSFIGVVPLFAAFIATAWKRG